MNKSWYSFFKDWTLGPVIKVWNRPTFIGGDKIPAEGPAIFATNHLAMMDQFYVAAVCPRRMAFLAKAEYFTSPGLVGKLKRNFMNAVGQVSVDREASDPATAALNAGKSVLDDGNVLGLAIEGTRSPDGRLYRGRTGTARVALKTGTLVYPIAFIGSGQANPIGSRFIRPVKVKVIVADPVDPADYDADDPDAARAMTDDIVAAIQKASGQDYVDVYGSDMKKSLEAGDGYPEGAEPGGALERPFSAVKQER